jgi:hydrogenase expression/formation protein HypD
LGSDGDLRRADAFHHPQRADQFLPAEVELVHGPGCPVCVTPLETIDKALEIASRPGVIPNSGWVLSPEFEEFDPEKRFDVEDIHTQGSAICTAGQILQGLKKPNECLAYGAQCTPETPSRATMVSSEGACAAYYRYRR